LPAGRRLATSRPCSPTLGFHAIGPTRELRREQRQGRSGGGKRQRRVGTSGGGGTGREQAANGFDLEHEWGFFVANRRVPPVSGPRGGPYLSAPVAVDGVLP
jgi:hypothetical protein